MTDALDPAPPDPLIQRVYKAAQVALDDAADAVFDSDSARAERVVKLAERLVKTAMIFADLPSPDSVASAEARAAEEVAARDELIALIDRTLAGDREGRRAEVAALAARGVDPRMGWRWDEAAGDWVWEPGEALARTAPRSASAESPDTPGPPDRAG